LPRSLEKYLYDDRLPLLVKLGLVHVQFESIHPFLDGQMDGWDGSCSHFCL